jgi:hypothetical protein
VSLVAGAGVSLLGAVIALLFLPARAAEPKAEADQDRPGVSVHVG